MCAGSARMYARFARVLRLRRRDVPRVGLVPGQAVQRAGAVPLNRSMICVTLAKAWSILIAGQRLKKSRS